MCCGQGAGCIGRPDVRRLVNDDPDLYLNTFIPQELGSGPNWTYRAPGVEQRRTPRRRFSGTVRTEHGPAESLTGATGTLAVPHRIPPRDSRIPVMEGWPTPTPTVIREPATGDTGVPVCRTS